MLNPFWFVDLLQSLFLRIMHLHSTYLACLASKLYSFVSWLKYFNCFSPYFIYQVIRVLGAIRVLGVTRVLGAIRVLGVIKAFTFGLRFWE